MDWNQRMIHSYPGTVPLPFFMSYPGYMGAEQEKAMLQDLEYLQQTYPNEVKRYQRKVADILDKFDYEGSMIYDEYPDRYGLQRMTETIIDILKREEMAQGKTGMEEGTKMPVEKQAGTERLPMTTEQMGGVIIEETQEEYFAMREREVAERANASEEKWMWMQWMIQVLLSHEIYKRRHGGRRGWIYPTWVK